MIKRAQVPTVERGACALYVSPGVSVSDDDIEAGFRWLEGGWDVLIPIKSYKRLANSFPHPDPTPKCWDLTEAAVLDLRQPVYDERVLFVKHGTSADDLLAARDEETCEDEDCPLPMLRAIWKVKPLLLALPESWVVEDGDLRVR